MVYVRGAVLLASSFLLLMLLFRTSFHDVSFIILGKCIKRVTVTPPRRWRTLDELNSARAPADDVDLVDIIRRVYLQRPAPLAARYRLKNMNTKDFSKGQSKIIDRFFKGKVSLFNYITVKKYSISVILYTWEHMLSLRPFFKSQVCLAADTGFQYRSLLPLSC